MVESLGPWLVDQLTGVGHVVVFEHLQESRLVELLI